MTPGKTPQSDFDQFGYMPYTYLSGQFRYTWPGQNQPANPRTPYATYDFTSEPKSNLNPDQPQTVEQIVANGYFTIPTGDPVTAMITDKKHTFRLGLDDAIDQIRRRYEIYDKNVYELLLSQCYTINTFLVHYDRC